MDMHTAVILAAGKGTRLEPFTQTTPKPLIKIANKPILEHNMDALYDHVDGYLLVVGYLCEKIMAYFGDKYREKPVRYVYQEQALGTGQAMLKAREHLTSERFILIYGDDLYDPQMFVDLRKDTNGIIGKKHESWENFGVLKVTKDLRMEGLVEKPKKFVSDMVNVGIYALGSDFLPYLDHMTLSVRGEYELTEAVNLYAQEHSIKVIPHTGYWYSVGYPWHILQANTALLGSVISDKNSGEVEPNVVIKGRVSVGKGTLIRSGAYIEGNVVIGENCTIGPNCYIRGNVAIGNNCKIGNGVEIEESVIGDKVNIEHLSFVGYSVIGNDVILGGGTITSDRRHDRASIRVNIKESLIDTGLCHVGAFIGDMVRTGIHTSIYPGRKLHYHSYTHPGEIVRQDKLTSEMLRLK
jgi:bifunctional UDP-N-acetylglucosamine pyrophosphorylase/glucosamine-1-phosphate N-acetyltransferase